MPQIAILKSFSVSLRSAWYNFCINTLTSGLSIYENDYSQFNFEFGVLIDSWTIKVYTIELMVQIHEQLLPLLEIKGFSKINAADKSCQLFIDNVPDNLTKE